MTVYQTSKGNIFPRPKEYITQCTPRFSLKYGFIGYKLKKEKYIYIEREREIVHLRELIKLICRDLLTLQKGTGTCVELRMKQYFWKVDNVISWNERVCRLCLENIPDEEFCKVYRAFLLVCHMHSVTWSMPITQCECCRGLTLSSLCWTHATIMLSSLGPCKG